MRHCLRYCIGEWKRRGWHERNSPSSRHTQQRFNSTKTDRPRASVLVHQRIYAGMGACFQWLGYILCFVDFMRTRFWFFFLHNILYVVFSLTAPYAIFIGLAGRWHIHLGAWCVTTVLGFASVHLWYQEKGDMWNESDMWSPQLIYYGCNDSQLYAAQLFCTRFNELFNGILMIFVLPSLCKYILFFLSLINVFIFKEEFYFEKMPSATLIIIQIHGITNMIDDFKDMKW